MRWDESGAMGKWFAMLKEIAPRGVPDATTIAHGDLSGRSLQRCRRPHSPPFRYSQRDPQPAESGVLG
jgi:hypothetical protein